MGKIEKFDAMRLKKWVLPPQHYKCCSTSSFAMLSYDIFKDKEGESLL